MYKAMDIAQYVINYSIEKQHPVSNLKLQKLLYYIQAAFLVKFENPCFEENIENWRHGPVVSNVYRKYKKYLNNEITQKELEYCAIELNDNFEFVTRNYKYDEANIKLEDRNLIEKVVDSYFGYSSWKLVDRTHEEDPWSKDSERDDVITNTSILKYFKENQKRIYGEH